MRKFILSLTGILLAVAVIEAQVTVPFTFSPNTTILSSQVNSNFSTLGNASLNRTGGTMTGLLTTQGIAVASGSTYDLAASGTAFRNGYFSGTLTSGTFSGSGASLTSIPFSALTATPAQSWNITGQTASYAAVMGDLVEVTSGSSITVTLPAASTATSSDYRVGLKNDTASVITVAKTGGDTIDGGSSFSTSGIQYESYDFVVNAAKTGWMVR